MPALPLILGGGGLLFLAIGLIFGKIQAGRGGHARAAGTVVEIETRDSYDHDGNRPQTHYRPVVAFEAAPGHKIVIRATVETNWSGYRIGQAVEVRFDPRRPEKAVFEGSFRRFLIPVIFSLIGAALLVAAALIPAP
ncbi:DUF3592 domain-containing protein [Zavarzinia compransoris]|uniref:DUF3592 domain-containing protein n=1 Tax=Zavarzinia compransoris TaxID=1264899 RepID=A0A317DYB5_9PROT|nr:DUF3592 domain-containing protein [Zavarzinia compransoris]PWR18846.1 hypothetical protein DKG75_17875 [Zavarzinia compransoris]TDP48837.1 uncharacterized protein DUF3592 [Zavarzinia compransoris]